MGSNDRPNPRMIDAVPWCDAQCKILCPLTGNPRDAAQTGDVCTPHVRLESARLKRLRRALNLAVKSGGWHVCGCPHKVACEGAEEEWKARIARVVGRK